MITDLEEDDRKEASVFSDSFPLWPAHQFDFAFQNSPWPLALHSTAPGALKQRIAAALTSHFMRLKSVDYTMKEYLGHEQYSDGDPARLDLVIATQIDSCMAILNDAILRISEVEVKTLGETIGEWTLFRAPFGMEMLITCANRGALFESLTIARMLLEQLAWSFAAVFEKNDDRVAKIEAQSSMRALKAVVPASGRLYGWLSDHAHWNYVAHIKSFTFKQGKIGHLFASAHFKAVAMCVALVLASIYLRSIDELMKISPDEQLHAHSLREKCRDALRQNGSMIEAVAAIKPDDRDLRSLANVLS